MDDTFLWPALVWLLGEQFILAAALIFGMFMVMFLLAVIIAIIVGQKDH